jgi:GGDEF domain-containing protein
VLQASLRRVDILSYNGAGRFAVVLPRVQKAQAIEKAREMVARLEADETAAMVWGRATVNVEAGVAAFPDDGARAPELLASIETRLMAARPAARQRQVR